jgi:hypothetical protein
MFIPAVVAFWWMAMQLDATEKQSARFSQGI